MSETTTNAATTSTNNGVVAQAAPVANNTSQPTGPANYGYAEDDVKVNPFVFGLNQGVNMTKFEWIPNGGKEGAEQEALDIVFSINGTDKNYRMFPVVKAFDANNNEVTDPNSQEMKDAMTDFNARITHILHAFMDSETVKAGLSRPINSFKEFCQLAMSLLPKNYKEIPLDIFLQFQWQIDPSQNRTFLEIPKKMKYGRWLTAAQPGTFKEVIVPDPTEKMQEALYYVNEHDVKHPIFKNGWFMLSNFAHQQRTGNANSSGSASGSSGNNTGAAKTATQSQGAENAKKSAW